MRYLKRFYESNSYESFDKTLITVTLSDDWEGIYHNGMILEQGHSIRWDEVISKLIKESVNLEGYKLQGFTHYKDGKYEDWTSNEHGYPVVYELPENITEYISKITEAGYTYEIK